MEDKGEDITFDFSKIKSIFSGKGGSKVEGSKKDESAHIKTHSTHNTDHSHHSSHAHYSGHTDEGQSRQEEAEFSLDFGKVKSWFTNLNPRWLVLLLVLIPLFLGSSIRLQTLDMHATDSWAEATVNNYYQNAILAQVDQQYPYLPQDKKAELVEENYAKLLVEQKDMIEEQINVLSNDFRNEFKDDEGRNYLPDIDTYYWIRFIENIDKNGHPGDELRDGKPFDNHFDAPRGREIPEDEHFHIYLGYYFYKLIKIFDPAITAMSAFALLPVALYAICSILIFFIARRIAGNAGGLIAALALAFSPYFITKSAAGFADTDIQVVFFPLLITFFFLEAFESRKLWKSIALAAVGGIAVGLFSMTWMGWWYIFDSLLAVAGIYAVYYFVSNRASIKEPGKRHHLMNTMALIVVFAVVSSVSVLAFTNWFVFERAYLGPFAFMAMKVVGYDSVWPNVYTTVAEQNEVAFSDIITKIGGTLMVALAALGMLLAFMRKDKNGHLDPKYALLLLLWFGASLYASTKGVRYILIAIPPLSVAFGAFAGLVILKASDYIHKELSIKRWMSLAILTLVFVLLLIPMSLEANAISKAMMPDVSDGWVRSLNAIEANSSETAILNSWWDFGHWFKYWANRPVTFDGTSQNTPKAHWIGKVLITSDEKEAIALLRMMDCGGDLVFNDIDKTFGDQYESVMLQRKIIEMDASSALDELIAQGIPEETAAEIVAKTHCSNPPENFLLTTEDMTSKSGVWGHFGSWNFERADMVLRVKGKPAAEGKQILVERYGLSEQQAEKFYYDIQTQDPNYWVAPWPSIESTEQICVLSGDLLTCQNGIYINTTNYEAYAFTTSGKQNVGSFAYLDEDGNFKVVTKDTNLITGSQGSTIGAILVKDPQRGYLLSMMAPELTTSLYTRLFYFGGAGLEHFDLFHADRDVKGQRIYVWKVDWDGK